MEFKHSIDRIHCLTEILVQYLSDDKTIYDFEEEFGCDIVWTALTINHDIFPEAKKIYNYVNYFKFKTEAAETYFIFQYGF